METRTIGTRVVYKFSREPRRDINTERYSISSRG